ncbi:MAG: class I SAM-dependent methyltransferase [Defluviitaleaceae bacterium]|nr:class I SAM-dependent methyltransferase [Defluviitaleaceae bacterium]
MDRHKIDLTNVKISGRILDIGGGGEGVIGRQYGEGVVAIDTRKDELEETAGTELKIVMDAADMQFIDNQFDVVTCFYSLMYMQEAVMEKAVGEAYRVLKPGGRMYIWDAEMPFEPTTEPFVAQLELQMNDEKITPGFGIYWNRGQSVETMLDVCTKAGFTSVENTSANGAICLIVGK